MLEKFHKERYKLNVRRQKDHAEKKVPRCRENSRCGQQEPPPDFSPWQLTRPGNNQYFRRMVSNKCFTSQNWPGSILSRRFWGFFFKVMYVIYTRLRLTSYYWSCSSQNMTGLKKVQWMRTTTSQSPVPFLGGQGRVATKECKICDATCLTGHGLLDFFLAHYISIRFIMSRLLDSL